MFALLVDTLEHCLPAHCKGRGPQLLLALSALVIFSMDVVQLVLVALGAGFYFVMNMPVHRAGGRAAPSRSASKAKLANATHPPSPAASATASTRFSKHSTGSSPAAAWPPLRTPTATAGLGEKNVAAFGSPSGELGRPKLKPSSSPTMGDARAFARAFSRGAGATKKEGITAQPVLPLSLAASGWDAQVDELLSRITPTAQTAKVVAELARQVKAQLSGLVSDVEVTGFAGLELMRGTAFGVAVPEVDIVACTSPDAIAGCFRGRVPQPTKAGGGSQMLKVQKKAVRLFTEHLVRDGKFKFRRSAFRGPEPKVTLLAAAELGLHQEPIPFDLTFNSTSPAFNAALLTEVGQLEPRGKALALLVKRWAKDRAMCHAAKGHLSPYAWTLLTIFFLQVGNEEGPLLPPLHTFEAVAALADPQGEPGQLRPRRSSSALKSKPSFGNCCDASVGQLFKRFVNFYKDFDFSCHTVSVLRAHCGAGDLPLNFVVGDSGATILGPVVEDPFDTHKNVATGMTQVAWEHFQSELSRAHELLADEASASLPELLEPWSRTSAIHAADGESSGGEEAQTVEG